jgi:23S rRNA pseudouridine1911/1915/1917 synthase
VADNETWTVEEDGLTLAAHVRARLSISWNAARKLIETGKVFVSGQASRRDDRRLRPGDTVEVRMTAPRPRGPGPEVRIVFDDSHIVVIDKPSGVSSVPYDKGETGTAMDLVRDAWRRQGRPATTTPLHVVHRIDKETSGLLAYAKSKRAEVALAGQFRAHTVERTYICVAHGKVASARVESNLIVDRGDGLRGSSRVPGQGKRAVTHIAALEELNGATLCEVRLETGKTHQIRIHLSERGHPLVGEKVYSRDYVKRGIEPIPSPRLLLHAATLGFLHPITEEKIVLSSELPPDFVEVLTRLRASRRV